MKSRDPDTARLLRWYPRAWRERYGEEFLAMVEDSLDGERPGWRLRLSVARAGLRERGRQARLAGLKAPWHSLIGRWWTFFVAGYVLVVFPSDFMASPPPARAWQATAMLDLLTAIVAFTGAALLAGGLVAVPAFARYLRAGGWPEIRRRIAWAAVATAAAGGTLAGLLLVSRSHTLSQLNASGVYFAGVLVTSLALVVALWRWSAAVTAMAKRLDLSPRIRSAEKMLGAAVASAVSAMISANVIWYSVIRSSVLLLLLGATALAVQGAAGYLTIRRAIRRPRLAPGRGR